MKARGVGFGDDDKLHPFFLGIIDEAGVFPQHYHNLHIHLYLPGLLSYHYHHHRLQTEPARHQPSSAQGFTQAAVHALIKQNPFLSSSSS